MSRLLLPSRGPSRELGQTRSSEDLNQALRCGTWRRLRQLSLPAYARSLTSAGGEQDPGRQLVFFATQFRGSLVQAPCLPRLPTRLRHGLVCVCPRVPGTSISHGLAEGKPGRPPPQGCRPQPGPLLIGLGRHRRGVGRGLAAEDAGERRRNGVQPRSLADGAGIRKMKIQAVNLLFASVNFLSQVRPSPGPGRAICTFIKYVAAGSARWQPWARGAPGGRLWRECAGGGVPAGAPARVQPPWVSPVPEQRRRRACSEPSRLPRVLAGLRLGVRWLKCCSTGQCTAGPPARPPWPSSGPTALLQPRPAVVEALLWPGRLAGAGAGAPLSIAGQEAALSPASGPASCWSPPAGQTGPAQEGAPCRLSLASPGQQPISDVRPQPRKLGAFGLRQPPQVLPGWPALCARQGWRRAVPHGHL